ncbi:hypothetical protein DPMN_071166 [Dreissena polymorpha]|uniref:Uncharacterized protein n=1 Tax=Dreissena polymorpha TaxID=45954 RepID=A0A9D4BW30_DREPO|nr:hypothetical protein DPMN_071166 [Dreissena polymorpha]
MANVNVFGRTDSSTAKCHRTRGITRKTAPPPGSHVFQRNGTSFKLSQHFTGTNVLTKFHEDWTINVTPRVKTSTPPGSYVFQPTGTIFNLFHDDWTTNVASRVLSRKTATLPGSHFHEDWTINVNVDDGQRTTDKGDQISSP